MKSIPTYSALVICLNLIIGCNSEPITVWSIDQNISQDVDNNIALEQQLRINIVSSSNGEGLSWLMLPHSDDLQSIPQDQSNPLSTSKIELGKLLFHDTAFATKGVSAESGTWSCASCHHAAAGFKSGVPQGIGEGGTDFGSNGAARRLSDQFDAMAAEGAANKPDIQPMASPSILNSAYQDVMLWNGQFGNATNNLINKGIPEEILSTAGTPKKENNRALPGLETQAIAGLDVHRLNMDDNSELQQNPIYTQLFSQSYPMGSTDIKSDAGKAIAAYERSVLSNQAPFQRWLRGEANVLNESELRGGILFFGKANCGSCHRGPALSSELNAMEDSVFMAVGFNDFLPATQPLVHGVIKDTDKQGRGGFTKEELDMYKFKVPQLYNLADAHVFGHGASFSTIREVLEYKNRGIAQNQQSLSYLDTRFAPLELSPQEIDDLEHFLTTALYDPNLARYQPESVPSGECIIVEPGTFDAQTLCPQ